jgi:hypothetical protein
MSEIQIQNRILLECTSVNCKLWRNHRGTGFQGKAKKVGSAVIINNPALVSFGMCNGASDIIGILKKNIDGKEYGFFVAIEVKTLTGKASKEQLGFIEMVKSLGGIAGVVRSVEEARRLLNEV